MKHITSAFLAVLLAIGLCSCNRELTSYVNPFVGTDGHGHTFPGAIVPFGMIQPGPDTRLNGWDGCSAYHYSDDTIYGFSHTHLSGTGCEDYGDILVMPFVGDEAHSQQWLAGKEYRSHFSHRGERAEPGYYSVILDKTRVLVELTASERTAFHRYTFPGHGIKGIVVDLTHRDKTLDCDMEWDGERGLLYGHRHSSAWSPNQRCFFAINADADIERVEFVQAPEGVVVDGSPRAYALLYFPENTREVELRVAVSAVDENGAIANLGEGGVLDFNTVRKAAHRTWEGELSKIEVEGGSREDRRNFYTSLYHCFTSPYLFSDIDGRYRGHDDSIHTCDEGRNIYTVFSLWDTYRALHPLLTLVDRERTTDFIYTFAKNWEQGGELPMWELAAHETHCMIGYHACPVILDALNAGILDSFPDTFRQELLRAMVATSNRTEAHRSYASTGYLGSEVDNESVSKTLEYAYDDWCIAEYASKIGTPTACDPSARDTVACDTAHPVPDGHIPNEYYLRSQSWKHIMDKDGFMHPRRNGGFVTPFSPTEVNNHYTEANAYQYSTYVPHDFQAFAEMLDGSDKSYAETERFLDSLFHTKAHLEGRDQADIDGLIGQYAHGNEPSHHAAYLYAQIGQHHKTAELVRRICLDFYSSQPDGEIGNDDCGQMAAWYVFSAMGFYPVCPGSDTYTIGSPLFDKVTVHLENGSDIVVNARHQAHNSPYIQQGSLDGKPLQGRDAVYIGGATLRAGCTLDFVMTSSPASHFGHEVRPLERTCSLEVLPAPYFSRWERRFNDSVSVDILSRYPDDTLYKIYYTTDGSTPTTASTPHTGPIPVTDDITIRAILVDSRGHRSPVVTQHLTRFVPDKRLSYVTEPDRQYRDSGEDGLVDRLYGSTNYRIGGWQGWTDDAEFVIDLLEEKTVRTVSVDCLSDCRSWIFFPKAVEVLYSPDGADYRSFGSREDLARSAMSDPDWNHREEGRQSTFEVTGSANCRYLKVRVKNFGKMPSWHLSADEQAWLFIDEIGIN